MSENPTKKAAPPEISPYLFPLILAFMGAWCFYDGWLTTDLEMLEHSTFNRVASGILLPWAIIDFIKTRKADLREKASLAEEKKSDVVSKDTQNDS
jgi:hypothetical protein